MSLKRLPLVLALVLATAACAEDDGGSSVVENSTACSGCLSGTTVMKHVADHLANDPATPTVRLAFDRAMNDVGHYGVQPVPDGECHGGILTGYWNGEEQALSRLGAAAVADLLALEAVTQGPLETSLLSRAPLGSGDTTRVFRVLAKTESPALVYEASWSLLANPGLSSTQFRALLAFAADVHDTKRFRDATGTLRVPDFQHAPALSTVLSRLAASPSRDMRAYAAGSLDRLGAPLTHAQADKLLFDSSYLVRSASGRLLWSGSDSSPAAQHAAVAWFGSADALKEMRADTLREEFGVSEEDAQNWSNLPAGIGERQAEAIGAFLGGALETAPASADISGLLDEVGKISDLTDLIETALAAIQRSTKLSAADKTAALLSLYHAADVASWHADNPAPLATLWQTLVPVLADAPATSALLTDLDAAFSYQRMKAGDWATLRAGFTSTSRSKRLASLTTLATSPSTEANTGLAAGLMALPDTSAATRHDLLTKMSGWIEGARVARSALAAGVDAHDVVDAMLAVSVNVKGRLPSDQIDALASAIAAPELAGPEITAAVTAWFTEVDDYWISQPSPDGAPSSGTATSAVTRMLTLLDDPRVSSGDRAEAWAACALANDKPRGAVLRAAPMAGPSKAVLAALLRDKVVVGTSTCWQGHDDPATTRPAFVFEWLPFLVQSTTLEVDATTTVPARVGHVRDASAKSAELADGADAAAVLVARPRLANLYLGDDPAAVAEREPAATVAAEVLGISDSEATLFEAVRRLAFAPDFASLSRSKLDQVEAHITAVAKTAGARDQHLFALEAMRGAGYDALAQRFHGLVDLRWDVGDAARKGGEAAALEAMLGAVGPSFGTLGSNIALTSQVISRAGVSSAFRQGLLEFDVEAERFWGQDGMWAAGTLPIVRTTEADLSFLARADATHVFGVGDSSGDHAFMARSALFGALLGDARVPPSVALTLAWNRLSTGHPFEENAVEVTEAIDAVLAVRGRADVAASDKAALGRALLRYLE